jgi:hypothetical protein
MKIADLFVNLGTKGGKKASSDVGMIEKGMKGAASASFEAKAAILAAFYASQQMFSASNQAGKDLTHFSNLMDTTTDTLQRYQYAARQAGVANEDVMATFKGIQSSMTGMIMGESVPGGFARVAELVGLDEGDILKFQKNPEILLQKLQQYAHKESNTGLRNKNLASFGISDGMIAAMMQNVFRPEVFAKAPVYSEGEIKSLNRANTAWSNLGNTIAMAFGRFNAQHGEMLVNGISKLVDGLIKLSDVVIKIAADFKVFDMLEAGVNATAKGIKDIAWFMKELGKAGAGEGDLKGFKPAIDAFKDFITWLVAIADKILEVTAILGIGEDAKAKSLASQNPDMVKAVSNPYINPKEGSVDWARIIIHALRDTLPSAGMGKSTEVLMRLLSEGFGGKSQGPGAPVTVNNTMNFSHPGVDPNATARDVGKSTKDAVNSYQNSPARAWRN